MGRRNLPAYVKATLALRMEAAIAEKAKANLRTRTADGGYQPLQDSAKAVDTRAEVARIAGVSHDTIHKVKAIEAKADDETKAKLRAGETTINREFEKLQRAEKRETAEARNTVIVGRATRSSSACPPGASRRQC